MADQSAQLTLTGQTKKLTGVAHARGHRPYLFDETFAITDAVAAGTDKAVLFKGFPGCVITDIDITLPELDSGTDAIVNKVVVRTAAGSESDLETGFTTGRAGGTLSVAKANLPIFLNEGSIVLVTSTAANTEEGGDVRTVIKGFYGRITGTGFNAQS